MKTVLALATIALTAVAAHAQEAEVETSLRGEVYVCWAHDSAGKTFYGRSHFRQESAARKAVQNCQAYTTAGGCYLPKYPCHIEYED